MCNSFHMVHHLYIYIYIYIYIYVCMYMFRSFESINLANNARFLLSMIARMKFHLQTFFIILSIKIIIQINYILFFCIINVGVRISLRVPRLIPRALKLTTM